MLEDYQVKKLALIKCHNESDISSKKVYELLDGIESYDSSNKVRLKIILDKLINSLNKKKVDLSNDSDSSKCCLYTFQSLDGNYQDSMSYQLLKSIFEAEDLKAFLNGALKVAQAYCNESHAQEGVLFVAVVEGYEATGLVKQLYIFKCDFTEVDRVAGGNDLFERVDNAILGELKKGLVFPFFNQQFLEDSKVKIYQATSSKYFSMFLNLEQPALRQEGYTHHIVEQLKDKYGPEVAEEFETFALNKMTSKKKEIEDGRFTQELPREEIVEIIENVMINDFNYSYKPAKMKFSLDNIDFSCEFSDYGKNVFLAQDGDEKFIIIRGKNLVDKGHINPIAMQKLDPLHEIIQLMMKLKDNENEH